MKAGKARRLSSHILPGFARRAGLAASLLATATLWPASASAASRCVPGDGNHIRKVCLNEVPNAPSYGHSILGDTPEWNEVTVHWGPQGRAGSDGQRDATTRLDRSHIFEDIKPRLIDLDFDGMDEILLVQSSFSQGARLIVLGTNGGLTLQAATPYIGRSNRWLALIGGADLDGDGVMEIAYIDRPHLAKTLHVWRYTKGTLTAIASQPGLTNHRIGENFISGGIRNCTSGPEIITVNANWSRLIATTLKDGTLSSREIGPHTGPESFAAALTCS